MGSEPAAKKRKTQEDLTKRARRLTIRLAAMANRCYWLSTTEIATHILTGGDCLQSHNNQRLFTRQLEWAFQECKRLLRGEAETGINQNGQQEVDTIAVQLSSPTLAGDAQKDTSETNAHGTQCDHDDVEQSQDMACDGAGLKETLSQDGSDDSE